TIFDIFPRHIADYRWRQGQKVFKSGKQLSFEDTREGRIWTTTVYPVKDKNGVVDRLAICAIDMTEQRQAENRFAALIEGSSDIIQVINAEGIMTYLSPSVERIMGYKPGELIGKPSVSIVHPDDLQAVQKGFVKAFENPSEPVYTVCRCRHKDGSWRVLAGMGINKLDNPAIRGFVANTRDITEIMENRKKLLESEEKFRSIMEQSIDGIAIVNQNGEFIEFNPGQEKITGLQRNQVLGKKVWDIQYRLMPDNEKKRRDYATIKKTLKCMFVSPESKLLNRIINTGLQRPDGEYRVLQTIVFPIHLSDTTLFASFNRDITDQKRTEDELAANYQNMQDKNAALREVMARLEEEKTRLKEQVHSNVRKIILPILSRTRLRAPGDLGNYLDLLENSLSEITSSYGTRISELMLRLTPRETELCTMIRNGLSSKDIARMTNISPRTVEVHRNRIRKNWILRIPGSTWRHSWSILADFFVPANLALSH
ncbi:MAG: PAS domain S-box protein, partial [Chitinivibrionales bacterium]|nr:PAS domain S-box protein [Chitinivibrionales bacterium]